MRISNEFAGVVLTATIFVVLGASPGKGAAPTAQTRAAAAPPNTGDAYPSNALTVSRRDGSNGPVLYLTLKALKFQETANGSSQLSGDVGMQFPYGLARAERATMTKAGKVTFTHNVRLLYGGQVIRGTTLVFEARTGALTMNGKQMPSGMPACDGPCR